EELKGIFVRTDVSDSAAVAAAFGEVKDQLGGLDLAHLNAGLYRGKPSIDDLTDEEYRKILGVNVDGVIFGVREAVRLMGQTETGGAIVVTASFSGLIPYPFDPLYSVTKNAVVGLVRSLSPNL